MLALTTSLIRQNGDSKCRIIECRSRIKEGILELKSLVLQECVVISKGCHINKGVILTRLEHLHPAALKGLGKPFDAALEKKLPHPSPNPRP